MVYHKTPITIVNATPEVKRVIEKLRAHKRAQVEKLRNMKPKDFSVRITL